MAPPARAAAAKSAPDPALRAITAAREAGAAGDHVRALEILEGALRANEGDARLRFAHAVALSEAGRTDAALAAFTALTEEFPELPEPHNNVATLYAARGELELARAHLEMALRARPGYALAHENLGDLYLRLAERAYQRAGQSEPTDAGLRAKLALAREWIERITAPR